MIRGALILSLSFLLACGAAYAQSRESDATPVGRWITIGDERNEPRSRVKVYESNGMLYADIEKVFPREGEPEDPVCEKCKGERANQPITGMTILWDMRRRGERWSGGKILDPENGKIYRCKIWIDDGKLKVRGFLGPFYRTQTWRPAD